MQRRGRPPGKGRGREADIEKAKRNRHNELTRGYRAQRTPEQRAAQNAQDRERQAANRADPVIGPHLRRQAARRARKPENIERRSQQREALSEEEKARIRARDREWHRKKAGIKTKAEYTAADKQGTPTTSFSSILQSVGTFNVKQQPQQQQSTVTFNKVANKNQSAF